MLEEYVAAPGRSPEQTVTAGHWIVDIFKKLKSADRYIEQIKEPVALIQVAVRQGR